MSKGDCYEANFNEFFLNRDTYSGDEWRLVHAMREHVKGTEWWGGHAFILNLDENLVFDFSNGAKLRNNGKELVVDAEEIYEQWSISKYGLHTYFEYTMEEAVKMAYETGHYGSWELKFEDWKSKDWGDYMKNYWIPNFEPKRHALEKKSK